MSEPFPHPERQLEKNKDFLLKKIQARNGFVYVLYCVSEEVAEKLVKDFWNMREGSSSTQRGLASGMLRPKHEITAGDRSRVDPVMRESEQAEYPGMTWRVEFNGNTEALGSKGVEALRKMGVLD